MSPCLYITRVVKYELNFNTYVYKLGTVAHIILAFRKKKKQNSFEFQMSLS